MNKIKLIFGIFGMSLMATLCVQLIMYLVKTEGEKVADKYKFAIGQTVYLKPDSLKVIISKRDIDFSIADTVSWPIYSVMDLKTHLIISNISEPLIFPNP